MAVAPDIGVSPNAPAARPTTRALRVRQTLTILLLFGGYGALYFVVPTYLRRRRYWSRSWASTA